MILAALETSQEGGGVAVAAGEHVFAARLSGTKGRGRDLVPALAETLSRAGVRPREIEVVAVGIGPGRYTGLRLAVATAKALCYAAGARLVAVPSTEVLAAHPDVSPDAADVWVAWDVRHGEVAAARYALRDGLPVELEAPAVLAAEQAARRIEPESLLLGDAVEAISRHLRRAPHARSDLRPRPEDLLRLARRRIEAGRFDDPFAVQPLYLRPSEAERRWRRRRAEREGDA